jgi:CRISPR-associated exonuclease Cas4
MIGEWDEADIIAISAIEHYLYCPRQCALIHVANIYEENRLTQSGIYEHERVHNEDVINDSGVRKRTGMKVYSDRLGIIGQADVIEYIEQSKLFRSSISMAVNPAVWLLKLSFAQSRFVSKK